jgi:ABC-type transport system substrate-binding protein
VKADGKYVVEMKTKQPFGAFPGVTMGYGGTIVSQKAHKEMGNDAYSATPVGNGPFQIESKRGTEIVLVKQPRLLAPGLSEARQGRLSRDSRFDHAPAGAAEGRARLRDASRSERT